MIKIWLIQTFLIFFSIVVGCSIGYFLAERVKNKIKQLNDN